MSDGSYSHRQFGWVILVAASLPLAIAVALLATAGLLLLALLTLGLWFILLLLFHSLKISVDSEAVVLRFGSGLIQKRFPLEEVRGCAPIKTHWYYGWGIRFTPQGTLYNVSGFDAVALDLKSGQRVCLGTDEPAQLMAALTSRLGPREPLSSQEVETIRRHATRRLLLGGGLAVLVVGTMASLLVLEGRAASFSLSPERLRIDSFMYGVQIPLADIETLELKDELPSVRARSNGYAFRGTLHGHFRIDELGATELFIERQVPPYILVKSAEHQLIFNLEGPGATRAAFVRLSAARLGTH